MSSSIPDDILTNPEECKKLTDEQWVALHVPRYEDIHDTYKKYEHFLREILREACSGLAPLAIIEARPKSIPSFAGKILLKREQYMDPKVPLPPDPLVRITDLCGGRVITQTFDQVKAVCQFIEKAFDIDHGNSEDVSKRLRPTEFGYRSIHYIVMVNEEKLKAIGIDIPVPSEIVNPDRLKAEIQVRTLLEHAWADIGHDMTYKTELKVPDRIHRQFAVLSAVLEGVDREFGRLVDNLEEFQSNFGAYHTPDEVEDEISRLRIVLDSNPENIDQAVKIAQLALSIGRHEAALEITDRYVSESHQGVQRVRGLALTEMHWNSPQSKEFKEGRRYLEYACSHPSKSSETLCELAECWAKEDENKARDKFREAADVDGTEPSTLSRYIEFEVCHLSSDSIIRLASPMIRSSMVRCRKQIEAGINLPRAWASLAVFHLFLNEPFKALNAIAQVISLCAPCSNSADENDDMSAASHWPCAAGRDLLRMRETMKRIHCIKEKLTGYDWFERALLLGLALRIGELDAIATLSEHASWGDGESHLSEVDHIMIMSGACIPELQDKVDAFKPLMLRAAEDLSFVFVCGGTLSGVSGLVGDVAQKSAGKIKAFGYHPGLVLPGVKLDSDPLRYSKNISSPGSDFTPLDPLQGWTDIIAAGIDPKGVKLLSYAGGDISNSEAALALAFGARVGILKDSELSSEHQFNEYDWHDHPNLLMLPRDSMTIRAFFLLDELPGRRKGFEAAAEKVHEKYVKSAIPKEPSLMSWKDLPESLKISNFHQVSYAENILNTAGLGIRPVTNLESPLFDIKNAIGDEGIKKLAEMEHGRWNVERLMLGWKRADSKDVGKKLSPYIVSWDELSAEIQAYDLTAITELPEVLGEAGLEIYKL
jgi:ppGpp synthetase/RelA/SpoT-type nucleotidyltranferase